MYLTRRLVLLAAVASTSPWLVACGGSSSGRQPQTGTVALTLSDSATDDWSVIGVKVLGIALVPKGGGTPVPVYSAPLDAPFINLVQLDQLGEVLGNLPVAVGTYSKALVTLGADPAEVQLTSSSQPEASLDLASNTPVPADEIKVRGATGPAGKQTTEVSVNLEEDLVVTDSGSSALDLEFDLGHPAFIVEHVPAIGTPAFTVNFEGPLRHRPVGHLAELVLRHQYGKVTDLGATSFIMTKLFPARPDATPETVYVTDESLTLQVDTTNGTTFYDMDAKTRTVLRDLSTLGSLLGKYVRVAARYEDDGSLHAVRVWASASFPEVWLNPEGHLVHVNPATDRFWVESEIGAAVPVTVNESTQYFLRAPESAIADATPIGTGTAFLTNLHRGFKVHVSLVDPTATSLVAGTIDLEIAKFDGTITLRTPAGTGFTYTRKFATPADDYVQDLPYISGTTPNGEASDGTPIVGFKWWDFAFPTLADTGPSAILNYEAAVGGSVNFGGAVGVLKVWGTSYATWGDAALPTGWAGKFTVLVPTPVPLGKVATTWVDGTRGGTFGMVDASLTGNAVTTSVSTVAGSATLVYEVNRTGVVVTVTPVDVSTVAGLGTLSSGLTVGALVKAYGVPQTDGSLKAYVLFFYTGTAPST